MFDTTEEGSHFDPTIQTRIERSEWLLACRRAAKALGCTYADRLGLIFNRHTGHFAAVLWNGPCSRLYVELEGFSHFGEAPSPLYMAKRLMPAYTMLRRVRDTFRSQRGMERAAIEAEHDAKHDFVRFLKHKGMWDMAKAVEMGMVPVAASDRVDKERMEWFADFLLKAVKDHGVGTARH